MKQCAVVLNGNDIVKVSNLKRKYDKIMNNPNMKILEECDNKMLDEKYNYWNRTLNRNLKEEKIKESKFYFFKNSKTGESILSIYQSLDHIPGINKEDWYVEDN